MALTSTKQIRVQRTSRSGLQAKDDVGLQNDSLRRKRCGCGSADTVALRWLRLRGVGLIRNSEVELATAEVGTARCALPARVQRAVSVGGSVGVKSAPGKGTTIEAQIPFGDGSEREKTRMRTRPA